MSKPLTMTRDLAYSIGLDAGNKSMRKAGRTVWDADDRNAASDAMWEAMKLIADDATLEGMASLDR